MTAPINAQPAASHTVEARPHEANSDVDEQALRGKSSSGAGGPVSA
jgi:hypothetical protein